MPGTIVFKTIEVNLPQDKSLFGKPEPYCVISLEDQKVKTKICKPLILKNEPITLRINDQPICLLEFKDQEDPSSSDNIGICKIDLDEIELEGSVRKWYAIYNQDQIVGEILLEASYIREDQTLTDFPKSMEEGLVSPEEDSEEEEYIWDNDRQIKQNEKLESYKYSDRKDNWLDEQLSPVEIESSYDKNVQKTNIRYSFEQKGNEVRSESSQEEFKTDQTCLNEENIETSQEKRKLSITYKNHPLETDNEVLTEVDISKGGNQENEEKIKDVTSHVINQNLTGKFFEVKSSGKKPNESKSKTDLDKENTSYYEIVGSHWDI